MQVVALAVPAFQFLTQFSGVRDLVAALLLGFAEQRQEVSLDVLDISLHATLVFWTARQTGRNQEPVVQRELAIGTVHQRVLERRDDDRRLQVVRGHLLGHAAEPLEGVDVAGEEGLLLLIEDHLPIRPAGVAQPA